MEMSDQTRNLVSIIICLATKKKKRGGMGGQHTENGKIWVPRYVFTGFFFSSLACSFEGAPLRNPPNNPWEATRLYLRN